jgi:hypothetical protein
VFPATKLDVLRPVTQYFALPTSNLPCDEA